MPKTKKAAATPAAPPKAPQTDEAMERRRILPPRTPLPGQATAQEVPLAKIDDGDGGRSQAGGDVEALAASMAAVGLLQPIGLVETGAGEPADPAKARYAVLYGRRRLKAAQSLGWAMIQAMVYPARVGTDAETVRRVEAVENLERLDLNPVEEVLAVSRLLEAVAGRKADVWTDAAPQHLERAADLLGRTVPWVRDRAYLTRLCPAVRAMVADRRLPLAQAREIAKLASAEKQTLVAEFATRYGGYGYEPGGGGMHVESVHLVRRAVAERLSTLRGVPWKPGVAFAGRPACDGCPDNSAHAVLFGIDKDDAAPEARCLNIVCYRAKMRAAEGAVAKTVSRLKANKDVAPTPAAVRQAKAPEYLRPAAVARQLARARGIHPKATKSAKAGAPKGVPYEDRPENRLQEAKDAWEHKVGDLVGARLVADPQRLACFLLAQAGRTLARHVQSWVRTPDAKVWKIVDPVLKRVAAATANDFAALAADVRVEELFSSTSDGLPLWIARRLAGLMGVDLPREPALEDFLVKPAVALAKVGGKTP